MEELPTFSGSATVTIVVNGAPIEIAIDGANAPITAGNFIDLVERNFYEGITFHRVVLTPTPFVVQAGDPNSRDPNFPPQFLGSGGFVDPETGEERTIPLEIRPANAPQPVLNQIVPPPVALPHDRGVISMARTDVPDSASSQFFITLTDQPDLDGRFAVFGAVTQGLDVVDAIRQGDRIIAARVTEGIIPSRVSSIFVGNNNLVLNDFINFVNGANLGLSFADGNDSPNNINLNDPQNQQVVATSPSGVRLFGGNDTVVGTADRDIVNGNLGNDSMFGAAGSDYFRGGQNDDTVLGGEGNDILNGNKGADSVDGGEGDDFLRGGQDNDLLLGGNGNDILIGDLGADVLVGGLGSDTFVLRGDDNFADRITDFDPQFDELVIVSDNISQVQFQLLDGVSTRIQLTNGSVIGEVLNVLPTEVQQSAIFTATTDAALRIG